MEKGETKKFIKKSLIRHPELTKPKAVVIKETGKFEAQTQKDSQNRNHRNAKQKISLTEPDLNTALNIIKEIESVESVALNKKVNVTELAAKRNAGVENKTPKELNFPYLQKLYSDLIPVCVKSQPQTLPSIARDYQVVKDKEPVLSKFHTSKQLPEYSFRVQVHTKHKNAITQFDGFKVYRTVRNWN
ncbi:hypothetical protein FQA39_LY15270 [Lamprigera yunnana]|nr:hypothetical protein FQA39_LY15270 [Lamprigera yunnana]